MLGLRDYFSRCWMVVVGIVLLFSWVRVSAVVFCGLLLCGLAGGLRASGNCWRCVLRCGGFGCCVWFVVLMIDLVFELCCLACRFVLAGYLLLVLRCGWWFSASFAMWVYVCVT